MNRNGSQWYDDPIKTSSNESKIRAREVLHFNRGSRLGGVVFCLIKFTFSGDAPKKSSCRILWIEPKFHLTLAFKNFNIRKQWGIFEEVDNE